MGFRGLKWEWSIKYIVCAMRNSVFGRADSEGPYQPAHPRSLIRVFNCSFTESLDTIECMKWEQMPGWDFAHTWDDLNEHQRSLIRAFTFANRLIVYNRMYEWRPNARIILCACTGWSEAAQLKLAHVRRLIFGWRVYNCTVFILSIRMGRSEQTVDSDQMEFRSSTERSWVYLYF